MSTDNAHLTQAAKDLLGEPDIVRVRAIQARRWIFYPRAKQALDRLNLLVGHPRGTRMPSVAIYGDSGMGKTMIMESSATIIPPVLIRRPAFRLCRFWQSR